MRASPGTARGISALRSLGALIEFEDSEDLSGL